MRVKWKTIARIQPIGRSSQRVPDERCQRTGKRVYPSRETAERQLTEWAHMNSMEGYAYPCSRARGSHWHITKKRYHRDRP